MWVRIGFQIYMEAKAEEDMKQTFKTLQMHWKGAVFRHTRFIIVVPQQQSPQQGDAKEKNTSHSSVSRLSAPKLHIKDGETFTILGKACTMPMQHTVSQPLIFIIQFILPTSGLKSTLAQVKESVLNVSDILRSPQIGDLQQEVKHWLSLLQEMGIYMSSWLYNIFFSTYTDPH